MADSHFSDDISALWGTRRAGDLEPGPRPAPSRPVERPQPPGPDVDAERVDKLERQMQDGLQWLADAMERQRAELAKTVEDRLSAIRADRADEPTARLADLEARLEARLDAMDSRLAPRLDALRSELQEVLDTRMAVAEAEWARAATARVAVSERQMSARLDAIDGIAQRMTVQVADAIALLPSSNRALAPLRRDIGALQSQVRALTEAVAELTTKASAPRATKRAAKPRTTAKGSAAT